MSAIVSTITPRSASTRPAVRTARTTGATSSGAAVGSASPAEASPVPVRTRLRITRRGRRVVAGAVALLAASIVGGVLLAGPGAVASDTASSTSFEYVTVQGGESLWQVAQDIAPTKDPRDVVSDLVRLNALGSAEVSAGQSLAVPEKYTD